MKIKCFIKLQTDKAILIETLELDRPTWIPLSVVETVHLKKDNPGETEIEIADWFWDKHFTD
jgi:hypothetical protein